VSLGLPPFGGPDGSEPTPPEAVWICVLRYRRMTRSMTTRSAISSAIDNRALSTFPTVAAVRPRSHGAVGYARLGGTESVNGTDHDRGR